MPIAHKALVNELEGFAEQPGASGDDRFLSVTSTSFDPSLVDLLLPLTVGASVHVAPSEAMTDPERMLSSGSVIEDMGYTVAYNLHRAETDPGRFERRATNTRMPKSALPEFREFIEIEGQAFLEHVDAWLTDHEIKDGDDKNSIRLGLGAYWIEGRKREES